MTYYDANNRKYTLIGCNAAYTVLEAENGDIIRISNQYFDAVFK